MKMAKNVAAVLASVWLIIIGGNWYISLLNPESRTAAFFWLFILSLPSSLLASIFDVEPGAGLLIMAILGLLQWTIIGFLLGFAMSMLRKALEAQ